MGSSVGETLETRVGLPARRSVGPLAMPMDTDDHQGVSVGGKGRAPKLLLGVMGHLPSWYPHHAARELTNSHPRTSFRRGDVASVVWTSSS